MESEELKKALILYHHGLGDVIMLTPVLRELFLQEHQVDLMCRKPVKDSGLLDNCPYIGKLIAIENPWWSKKGRGAQSKENLSLFNELKVHYDWSGEIQSHGKSGSRIEKSFTLMGLDIPNNLQPEVFISQEIEREALNYINKNYPDGYIFNHTNSKLHNYHNWDSSEWIANNLPDLPIVDTSDESGKHEMMNPNINFSFVLAREAKYRVLCSSVYVHACDAMNCVMDAVNYGRWYNCGARPINKENVLNIRFKENWVNKWFM